MSSRVFPNNGTQKTGCPIGVGGDRRRGRGLYVFSHSLTRFGFLLPLLCKEGRRGGRARQPSLKLTILSTNLVNIYNARARGNPGSFVCTNETRKTGRAHRPAPTRRYHVPVGDDLQPALSEAEGSGAEGCRPASFQTTEPKRLDPRSGSGMTTGEGGGTAGEDRHDSRRGRG